MLFLACFNLWTKIILNHSFSLHKQTLETDTLKLGGMFAFSTSSSAALQIVHSSYVIIVQHRVWGFFLESKRHYLQLFHIALKKYLLCLAKWVWGLKLPLLQCPCWPCKHRSLGLPQAVSQPVVHMEGRCECKVVSFLCSGDGEGITRIVSSPLCSTVCY